MGYNQRTWRVINNYLKITEFVKQQPSLPPAGTICPKEKYYQSEWLELGCGVLRGVSYSPHTRIAREYFESLGIRCLTIDIAECAGSLKVDLRKPMMKYFHNRFDMILNAGTSEHVSRLEGQYQAFKNIHDCAKNGGTMIHIVPYICEANVTHSYFSYTLDFFKILAKLNNYKVIDIGTYLIKGERIYCKICFQKQNNDDFTDVKDNLLRYIIVNNENWID
ncbi:hypothetical protein LCGC14_2001610 [marine sediment metagenome]|uniref:Methyltransferase type 11 domain-containing protein n=1 Tax=marine sediment metagenome TaxID=412755 RepID=A0A0F9HGI9_9ZZZZ